MLGKKAGKIDAIDSMAGRAPGGMELDELLQEPRDQGADGFSHLFVVSLGIGRDYSVRIGDANGWRTADDGAGVDLLHHLVDGPARKGIVSGDAVFVGLGTGAVAVGEVRGMEVVDTESGLLDDFEVEDLSAAADDDGVRLPIGELAVEPVDFHFAGVDGHAGAECRFDGGDLGVNAFLLGVVFPDTLLQADLGFGIDGVIGGDGDRRHETGMVALELDKGI